MSQLQKPLIQTPPVLSPETPTLNRALAILPLLLSGSLAQVAVLGASGLLLVATANWFAVRGEPIAETLFWVGLLVIFVPFALRLVSTEPTRAERLVLLLGLGIALYLSKVIHSPVAFTFPDEFIHLRNLDEILSSHHLFNTNGILPATPFYPGLEIVTAAVVNLSGLAPFYAGLVVIGVARLMILLALYLLFEQLTGSARVASVGALLYTANANYLFWTAQFSYESLSLPLAAILLYALTRRAKGNHVTVRSGFTVAAVLLLLAVIVTHHLTSYVLVALLCGWAFLAWVRNASDKRALTAIALFATVATAAWLTLVATPTIYYLAPVFRDALGGLVQLVGNPSSGRELFRSSTGYVAPLWERLIGIGAVLVTLVLLPFGLWQLEQTGRSRPLLLVLASAALLFPLLLPLRLARASWEVSNRTSEFLFLGVGLVLAFALLEFDWQLLAARLPVPWRDRAGFVKTPLFLSAVATLLFVGGAITGWPPNARLQHPYYATVNSHNIYPQGVMTADWMRGMFEENSRVAADYANGRLLIAYGNQYPLTGDARGIRQLLDTYQLDRGMIEILQNNRIQYVLVDQRRLREDPLVGIYFTENFDQSQLNGKDFKPDVYLKFDKVPQIARVFTSGDIFLYKVEAVSGYSPTQ